jgi:transcriptional regulator with XRE-family HTH domain
LAGHPEPPLGGRLRTLRLRRFLTQDELAQRSGLTRTTIQRLEADQCRPRIRTVTRLAAALGVDPDQLVPDPALLWGEDRP